MFLDLFVLMFKGGGGGESRGRLRPVQFLWGGRG